MKTLLKSSIEMTEEIQESLAYVCYDMEKAILASNEKQNPSLEVYFSYTARNEKFPKGCVCGMIYVTIRQAKSFEFGSLDLPNEIVLMDGLEGPCNLREFPHVPFEDIDIKSYVSIKDRSMRGFLLKLCYKVEYENVTLRNTAIKFL
jgi:hypothetical protein